MTIERKRSIVESGPAQVPIYRRCELLGLSRSSLYYKPRPPDKLNEELMRRIDEQYTRTPFYGSPRMTEHLKRAGYGVNRKRVRRLMRRMGLEAVGPKPRLSRANGEHRKYPYLLRNLKVDRPDQVWCSDITYIRLSGGFMYLTAVMDWHTRYVLSWELSNTLDSSFCVSALDRVLRRSKPEIFNTDQGSQYTSDVFVKRLKDAKVRISMDGRGRVFDNIFVERLWRTVKYEEVYLKDYRSAADAREHLRRYFDFYNNERPHQSLGYRTPSEAYFGGTGTAGRKRETAAAVIRLRRIGLRPSSVTAACGGERVHLNSRSFLS